MARSWRVGTCSMGVSLILLGVLFPAAQFEGERIMGALLTWWPIVFCLLGAELLLYVFLGRKDNAVVRYDILSILFIGMLSATLVGLAALSSIGVVGEIRQAVGSIEQSYPLPELKQSIPEGVKKVVVQQADGGVRVDQAGEHNIQVLGSYRMSTALDEKTFYEQAKPEIHTIGDTMYVSLLPLPRKSGLFSEYPSRSVTVVVPAGMNVELRGRGNETLENSSR